MKLSHSKLSLILNSPMEYFLTYKEGIFLKVEKPALAIGSAVHWGIEHNTNDLEKYYQEQGNDKQKDTYTKEEILATAMVGGYLTHKEQIFKEILQDPDDENAQLELLGEEHEVTLYAPLKSYKFEEDHEFMGIIDLLLITNKGFIIVDYKTSSQTPDWTKYLDQIYRYIFLLKHNYPDVPIVKIGIVNLKKSGIKQKAGENDMSYLKRLNIEYNLNDTGLINTHMYNRMELDDNLIDEYIDNLSIMADTAQVIENNELFYTNFANLNGVYGKSAFYDIIYKTPGCYSLYKIKDTVFDKETDSVLTSRECVPLDMLTVEKLTKPLMNKYKIFKDVTTDFFSKSTKNKDNLFTEIKANYETDEDLLENYWITYEKNI